MKLRLMKTPVRIQHPSSRISVPNVPMYMRSRAAVSMPNVPPHPVEQQRLQRSAKQNPRVSDPRIVTISSGRNEWLKRIGRRRMIRTPARMTSTGMRMPNRPNDWSTSRRASRAPLQPQRFSGSIFSVARSSALISRLLWSAAQLKNEKKTADAA